MKVKRWTKLFFTLLLSLLSSQLYAEYYGSYSTSDYNEHCSYCRSNSHQQGPMINHQNKHLSSPTIHHPIQNTRDNCPCKDTWTMKTCECCPHYQVTRTEWGDYVIFSSNPTQVNLKNSDESNSYDPDTSTRDDTLPEIGVE